jgi:hypothetical protein
MTTRYTAFLTKYDQGLFKDSTSLSVKLCDAEYAPDENHTLKDINGVILTATGVLTWKEFCSNGMSEIMDLLKNRAEQYRELHPDRVSPELSDAEVKYYVVYSGWLNVPCFCEEVSDGK